MYSPFPAAALALLASPAFAQSVTNIYLPGFSGASLQASVVNAESTAATYSVVCTAGPSCNFPSGASVTVARTSAGYLFSQSSGTVTLKCAATAGTPTACSGTASVDSGPTTATSLDTGAIGSAMPVTITSGMQKLTALSPAATSGGGGSSMSGSSGQLGGNASGGSGAMGTTNVGSMGGGMPAQTAMPASAMGARVRAGAGAVGAAVALAPLFL